MNNLLLIPTDANSQILLERKDFALVGVSPFNSYFSSEKILEILHTVHHDFLNFAVFIPDKISSFTLQALGYEQNRVNHKIRKQDNYLKNKVIKALTIFSEEYKTDVSNKVITLSSLSNNGVYLKYYRIIEKLYEEDEIFKQGCLETSLWVLTNHNKYDKSLLSNNSLNTAVQYFLKELPLFLWADKILNIKSCCFIYPNIPCFLLKIYKEYNLSSVNQGFIITR